MLGSVLASTVLGASGVNRYGAHVPDLDGLRQGYLLNSIFINAFDRLLYGKRPKLSDKNTRYSFFYRPQVDRAVILKILTKTSTLVKAAGK